MHLAGLVGHGQTTAGRDHGEGSAHLDRHPLQRPGHFGQMRKIGATADVHVEAADLQARPLRPAEDLGNLLVPDAVLRALTAGVGLLAVAVAEARVHAERDRCAGHPLGELLDHVGRSAVDVDAVPHDHVEAVTIEDVGRIDDWMGRRQAVGPGLPGGVWRVAGDDRAVDLAGAHRVDQHALAADNPEHRKVGAGLLREADGIPGREVAAPAADRVRVVHVQGRAILRGEVGDAHAGDLAAQPRFGTSRGTCGGRCDHGGWNGRLGGDGGRVVVLELPRLRWPQRRERAGPWGRGSLLHRGARGDRLQSAGVC